MNLIFVSLKLEQVAISPGQWLHENSQCWTQYHLQNEIININ